MRITQYVRNAITWLLLKLIRLYQLLLSPLLGQNCRFYPTCSNYAQQALKQHGLLKGTVLSVKRIVKCHPLHPGGIDEVPKSCSCNVQKSQNKA